MIIADFLINLFTCRVIVSIIRLGVLFISQLKTKIKISDNHTKSAISA